MKIGYAKLGRSWQLDEAKASTVGGDIDVIRLLKFLAKQHPEHEFVLVGRNTGQNPQSVGYPDNVTNPWTGWKEKWWMPTDPKDADKVIENFRSISGDLHKELDHIVIWAGQHGSANSMIPMIKTDWVTPPQYAGNVHGPITGGVGQNLATPQFAFMNYCSWLLDFVSRWREVDYDRHEEVWLMPDPRNYLKCREARWPLKQPIIAQFDMKKTRKHERYGNFDVDLTNRFKGKRENSVWVAEDSYLYSGLELTALPHPNTLNMELDWARRKKFGMVINENRKGVTNARLDVMKQWVMPFWPDCPIYGKWTDESMAELNRKIEPVEYPKLHETLGQFKSTLTTPASGSGWATSKPWECFAVGTVCFFHPGYDVQGHIIPTRSTIAGHRHIEHLNELFEFLRVSNPEELKYKVELLENDPVRWSKIVLNQRMHFENTWNKYRGGALKIEKRLGLPTDGTL